MIKPPRKPSGNVSCSAFSGDHLGARCFSMGTLAFQIDTRCVGGKHKGGTQCNVEKRVLTTSSWSSGDAPMSSTSSRSGRS